MRLLQNVVLANFFDWCWLKFNEKPVGISSPVSQDIVFSLLFYKSKAEPYQVTEGVLSHLGG